MTRHAPLPPLRRADGFTRARFCPRIVFVLSFLLSADALASPPAKPPVAKPAPAKPQRPSPPPLPPPPPLPLLPSIARVRVELLKSQLVVITEVSLPRGDWRDERLDFYAAFGAPGAPRAMDARLVAVGDGALESDPEEPGEALTTERVPTRPASAYPLIGKDSMAGIVVHVPREVFSKALTPGNMAALRLRAVLDLPDEDAEGARGVVVRLGASRSTPLTLGRLSVLARASASAPQRAEARLCGPDAVTTPLAISVAGAPKPRSGGIPGPIAPVLAVRHASDDVCIRFWP